MYILQYFKQRLRVNFTSPAIILWSVTTLFFAFQFILRLSVGMLRQDIMIKYNVDVQAFGNLAGAYYLGYALMQIPFGLLLDKYNIKTVTIFGILITILGTLPFIYCNSWDMIIVGRFLIGCGSAVSFLAVTKVIKSNFDEKFCTQMIGLSFTFGLMGAVFGGRPMKFVFDNLGYTNGFILITLINLIIAIVIFVSKRDKSDYIEIDNEINHNEFNSKLTFADLRTLIIDPKLISIGIAGGLMVGALEGFTDVWAIYYFNKIYNFNLNDSILIASLVYVGMCFGGPILAHAMKFLRSAYAVLTAVNIAIIAIFLVLFNFISWNFYLISFIMILLGILCCYQVIIFGQVSKIFDKRINGLAIAITNCLNMSFGYLFHICISYMMQHSSKILSQLTLANNQYNVYVLSLALIPISCIAAMMLFRLIKNRIN